MRSFLVVGVLASPLLANAVAPGIEGQSHTTDFTSSGRWGILVGPDLVLTAKHVGARPFTLPGYGNFPVVGSGIENPESDLMLFRINTLGMTLPYVNIHGGTVADGAEVTMVGWGTSGVLNASGTGYTNSLPNGTRRKAHAFVSRTEFTSYPELEVGYALISILRENGQGALYSGDSGNGWYQEIGGTQYLVGINSFIDVWGSWDESNAWQFSSSNEDYFASGAVSLSHYTPWLVANGAVVVPEPSSLVALSGLAFLARTRRNRNP